MDAKYSALYKYRPSKVLNNEQSTDLLGFEFLPL
jgi:hypothetical protein